MTEDIETKERKHPWKHKCAWKKAADCWQEWTTYENTPQTEKNSHGICPPCKEMMLEEDGKRR